MKRAYAAQFIGEAFVTAYNLIMVNKDKVEAVANTILEEKEIYGDELVGLLADAELRAPRDRLDRRVILAEDHELVEGQRQGSREGQGKERRRGSADDA